MAKEEEIDMLHKEFIKVLDLDELMAELIANLRANVAADKKRRRELGITVGT